MTTEPVELQALLDTRDGMLRDLQQGLDTDERSFLSSLIAGEPDWKLLGISHLRKLPAIPPLGKPKRFDEQVAAFKRLLTQA